MFTVVLSVVVGVIAALATRRVSRLVFAVLFAGAVGGTFVFVSLPIILHQFSAGANRVAGHRFVFESDLYGLRISSMLLPTPQHWISWLGKFARGLARKNPFPGEGGQAVGTIGVIGVLAATGMFFVRSLRFGSSEADARHRRPLPPPAPIAAALATIVMVAILLGAGGATVIDSLSGFFQVRTWDRIVVVIAFAGFALTGLGCERLLRRIARGVLPGRAACSRPPRWCSCWAASVCSTAAGRRSRTRRHSLPSGSPTRRSSPRCTPCNRPTG